MLLDGWAAIPCERFRTAAALGFGPGDVARLIERPMLRDRLPGAVLAVFLICLTSFAVALTIGGGPRATTVELAIYQAFRFEFDPGRAATLSLLQTALCLAAGIAVLSLGAPVGFGAGKGRHAQLPNGLRRVGRLSDPILIVFATLFLAGPILALLAAGLPGLVSLPAAVWEAAARSATIAVLVAVICPTLALLIAVFLVRLPQRGAHLAEALALMPIVISPLVLGTAAFLVLRTHATPQALALPVTLGANTLLSLPFALRILLPAVRASEAGFGRLADSLGLCAGTRLLRLTLPQTARPLGFAAGLTAAFSMGDLGAIALFADPTAATLPYQLSLLMGSYRMDDAHGAALLLVVLGLALFAVLERGGNALART
jgi:thiamine transport system permease protein